MSLRASTLSSPLACSGDMNSGEPVTVPSIVSCGFAVAFERRLGQAEVEQLGHVEHAAAIGAKDVGRLDVAMHQPDAVRLVQRGSTPGP